MQLSLPLGAAVLSVLCYLGHAQKLPGLKGEVELITEPRPGNEFVQIHTTNGEKTPSRFLKHAGNKIGGAPHINLKSRGLPESERDIPIVPAKDKRLLRLTAHQESNEESDQHEMHVSVIDEGKTGFELEDADEEEKKILEHKIEPASEQQEYEESQGEEEHDNKYIDNVSLYMESKSGIKKSDAFGENDDSPVKQLSTSKPLLEKPRDKHPDKKATEKKYDILTFNKQKNKKYEDNFDFVDSPFEDKLVPSGTSQTSRINVKKGPNGQDYEYEYVYYYYDEDDENKGQQVQPAPEAPKQRPAGRGTTTPEPIQTSWRQQTPVTTPETVRAESPRTRGRPNDNTKYTISGAGLEQDIPTEKISNELLPAVTSPSRVRGRPQSTEAVTENSLPEGTRFPSRGRGSTTTPFVSSTPAVPFDSPPTRSRGNIRRPSLELVDSSSFRTHSSDVSPDQDQNKQTKFRGEPVPLSHVIHSESFTTQPQNFDQQFQTRPAFTSQRNPIENTIATEPLQEPVPINRGNSIEATRPQEEFRGDRVLETTRESDLEEFIPQTDVPATGDLRPRGQFATDRPASTLAGNTGMPDKAAFDLYAIMQQIHNEESNFLTEDNTAAVQVDQNGFPIPVTAEFPTTIISSTTTTTTTTPSTTTTPAPTTTPTPVEEVPALPSKRFKSNLAQRNRFKIASSTTTTEVPAEQSTLRSRQFQPSKTRPQGQPSAYARRQKTSTTAPSEEASSPAPEETTRPKSRFGSRNRFGAGASSTSTTPASAIPEKPSPRPSSSSGFSARRRPGSRLGASSSTSSSEDAESSSPAADSAQTAAATPSSRARLPGSSIVRPLRPGPRINIGGARGRLGLSSTTVAPEENKSTSEGVSADGSVSESVPQPQEQQSEAEGNAESSPAEAQPSTTPDALTRLRNRPRLQPVGRPARPQPVANVAAVTPSANASPAPANGNAAASPTPNRRALGGLLGRQRPGQATSPATAAPAPVEEEKAEESAPLPEGESPSTEATQATTENKISSLISRRRNIAARRPGTIQTRSAAKETSS